MAHLRATPLTPILVALVALVVLGVLRVVLPMPLPAAANERSLADCLMLADTPSSDIASLERCHALVPDDVELTADLAAAYASAGRADDAIGAYGRVLDLDPFYADARERLARLLIAKGDKAAARAQIDAALRVQPNRSALVALAREAAQ